ncbi:MAG: RimK family alpha-L-glutamate ligase [Candidatus Geothermarchaeales archaeon]
MKIGILTRNENAWHSFNLKKALEERHVQPVCFSFTQLIARVGLDPPVSFRETDLGGELGAIVVRPIGRGSVDEIIFRLDTLHRLSRMGLPIINHPAAIEKAVDKYYALTLLSESGIPVPRTVVTESIRGAVEAFREFGGEAIVKPVFGSRGIGVARISDPDIAERVFRTLRFHRHVIYVQEFVPHGVRDIRTFVVGNRVVAAMLRVSDSWKTNIWRGAKPIPFKATDEIGELALKVAETIGCEVAGIDMMESREGILVNEVNSQPGWRGLQSTTHINIAGEIADYVIERSRR